MRFLTGIGGIGCFMVTFVLAVEFVGAKYTMLIGIAIEIPFAYTMLGFHHFRTISLHELRISSIGY